MKKGWKIFWGICGSLIAIGVICCIVGAALGGSLFGSISKDWSTNQKIFEETVNCGIGQVQVEFQNK